MGRASRDDNRVPTIIGVDSVAFTTPTEVAVDATTHELLVHSDSDVNKTEDSGHTTGDKGVMILGVRNDAVIPLTTTNLDYSPIAVDSTGSVGVYDAGGSLTVDATHLDIRHLNATDDIVQLGASTASIGKLAANDGVDIGNVDVTSVIPGTGVTNLGKAVDDAAGATDTGVVSLGVVRSTDTHGSMTDGDYARLSLTDFRELKTRDQRAIDLANCNVYTDYTALSNDTTGLANATNHVFGVGGLTFNKVNGSADTVYGGVSKSFTAINIAEIFEAGGFVGLGIYLPSLTNVVNVFLRIGTDASNYNCWTWPVASLTAATWLNLRQPAATPDYSRNAGNGWNTSAVGYVAFGVEFNAEANTLAGIVCDHVHIVGGRVTATDLTTAVSTSVNTANINVHKVGGTTTDTNNGTTSAGTQRVTLSSDSTGQVKLAAGTAEVGFVKVASGSVASGAVASGAIADGANVTLGAKADARSTATDATAVTAMQVLKEISYMEQNPASRAVTGTFWQATQPVSGTFWQATQPVSLASVPSHAVTNAGTFAVQVDGAALTALQLIDNAVSGSGYNITQLGGQNVSMGTGTRDAGTQRVTIATNDAVPVTFTGSTDVATQTTLAAINTKLVTGTDIGDVTINNSTGASAVNIQDGGNTITVDGTVTANLSSTDNTVLDDMSTYLDGINDSLLSVSGSGSPTIDSYTHAAINLNAGANQVLVSSAASKQIWVYGIGFVVNAAGTVSFQDEDDTAITGIMPIAANSGIANPPSGNFAMPIWKLATNKDLEVDIVTSELDGWIDYAIVSV